MRRVLLPLLLVLLASLLLASAPESDNAVAASDVSATVTFSAAHKNVHITNDGSNAVWVRIWQCDETPAAITTASSGARKVLPSEGWGLQWDATTEPEATPGYCAVTHITSAGTTTTFRLFAK